MNNNNSSCNGSSAVNGTGAARRARVRSLRPIRSSISGEIALTPDVIAVDPMSEVDRPVETLPDPGQAAPEPSVDEHETVALEPSVDEHETAVLPAPAARHEHAERAQWCSIVFERGAHGGEFHAVEARNGGRRKVIASSRSFVVPLAYRISWWRRLPNRGRGRRAHAALVKQLIDSGWRQMETRGRWHDNGFVRSAPAGVSEPPQGVI